MNWWRRPVVADASLAAVVTVVSLAGFLFDTDLGGAELTAGIAVTIAGNGVLAWRRRRPFAVLAAVTIAGLAGLLVDSETGFVALGFLIALYTVAAHVGRPRSLLALPFAGIAPAVTGSTSAGTGDWLPDIIVALLVWMAGDIVGWRRQRRALRLSDLRRDQQMREQEAVRQERARIARELHDIVSHAMSGVVVQAAAARETALDDPARADEAFTTIERTGRQALVEMRRMLGVLRSDADDRREGLEPAPSLTRIADLVESVRASGLDVTCEAEGPLDELPPGVALSAYRVVQESLTNVVKHGDATRVDVKITCHDGNLDVDIDDDGRGTDIDGPAAGHGLIGMRERVALHGGTLAAGPRPGGGFRVRATLRTGSGP